jgi:predicted DNA binding CopG/RHH family protein
LARDTGAKEKNDMKRETRYREAPRSLSQAIKESEVVKDFLPPPEQLIRRDEQVKVTINLSKRSIDFFKRVASHEKVPYQTMIKNLLDLYADRYQK